MNETRMSLLVVPVLLVVSSGFRGYGGVFCWWVSSFLVCLGGGLITSNGLCFPILHRPCFSAIPSAGQGHGGAGAGDGGGPSPPFVGTGGTSCMWEVDVPWINFRPDA